MNQPPWMPVAWAELGVAERPGAASNPRVVAYFRKAGHGEVTDDETAWCAAFVGACLEGAGLASTRSLAARSYLSWGIGVATPSPGAVTVLSRGSDPALGHVGFLVGLTDSHVILLGGNQSDAVTVAAFDRSRVLGYRLPSAAAVSEPRPPAASPAEPLEAPLAGDSVFERALASVLAFEGGWSDDPFDPGGATNKGITIGEFARERGIALSSDTIGDLKYALRRISDAEVRRIYLERYWHPAACPSFPPALALFHFDAAVNQGVAGAARMLQAAVGVPVDGEIGPITLSAVRGSDPGTVLQRYAENRRRHYRSLGHFWRFGRGWLRRVDETLATALGLAASTDTPRTKPISERKDTRPMTDTRPADTGSDTTSAEQRPTKWWGESLTIWGALLTAVSTVAPAIFAAVGIDMPADLIQRLGRDTMTVAQAIAGLVGTVMTVMGRLRASSAIGRREVSIRL